MPTELESYYKDYIFKTHIAYTDEKCIERGVFATEDIKIGDILLKMPMTEVMKGTHVELTYALMDLDNEYSRSLPVCITNFPVMWTESEINGIQGSAMQEMIPSRKKKLMEEDVQNKGPLFLHYRLLVGSRAFCITDDDKDMLLVPYADMLNHSNNANVDWKVKDGYFIMKALHPIAKDAQCFDTYGVKTNYEQLLFYGMNLKDNLRHDITYEMIEIPVKLRTNLNYNHFRNVIEYEMCGSYSRGTHEIFSFLRFLACANASSKECPKQLNGFTCDPISKANELVVARMMYNAMVESYNKKISHFRYCSDKVASFAETEVNVLQHWVSVLKIACDVLNSKSMKEAKKKMSKVKDNDYLHKVVKKLVFNKQAYKSKG